MSPFHLDGGRADPLVLVLSRPSSPTWGFSPQAIRGLLIPGPECVPGSMGSKAFPMVRMLRKSAAWAVASPLTSWYVEEHRVPAAAGAMRQQFGATGKRLFKCRADLVDRSCDRRIDSLGCSSVIASSTASSTSERESLPPAIVRPVWQEPGSWAADLDQDDIPDRQFSLGESCDPRPAGLDPESIRGRRGCRCSHRRRTVHRCGIASSKALASTSGPIEDAIVMPIVGGLIDRVCDHPHCRCH